MLSKISVHLKLVEKEATAVDMILRQINEEKRGHEKYWIQLIRAKVVELLWIIQRANARPQALPKGHPVVVKVMDYLEQNFARPIQAREMAAFSGFSHGYLIQIFCKFYGMGIKRYLLQRRIVEAKRLLENEPNLKVTAIARMVGFNSFADFNRAFKIITGFLPSAYRNFSYRDLKN